MSEEDAIVMMARIRREMALAYQWQILVDITGSEETAARVVAATPFLGVPQEAIDVLERES